MRKMQNRIFAAAAALSLLPGLFSAVTESPRFTASAVSGEMITVEQYAQSYTYDAKVNEIVAGSCGVYADYDLTAPVSLPVGSRLNVYQLYYVPTIYGKGWSGMQCYIYAQGVYWKLFGEMPGNCISDTERCTSVVRGAWTVTPELLIGL